MGADNSASMSQPRVSLSIEEVVNALNVPAVLQSNIKFPNTAAERRLIIQRSDILSYSYYFFNAQILMLSI